MSNQIDVIKTGAWTYQLENAIALIENKNWSNESYATIKPLEVDSDSSGNLYILSAVFEAREEGFMPGERTFLGNTLTTLSSTGQHLWTIEVADAETGNGYWSDGDYHRVHLATSSTGISLINTGEKAILVNREGNIENLVNDPTRNEYSTFSNAIILSYAFCMPRGSSITASIESSFMRRYSFPLTLNLVPVLARNIT